MIRPSSVRLPALALLLALLCGGLGLPLFDALVFHGTPVPVAGRTVAPDGTPAPHTALCILDHPGLLETSLVSRGHAPLASVPAAARVAGAPASATPAATTALLPPSRAPPVV